MSFSAPDSAVSTPRHRLTLVALAFVVSVMLLGVAYAAFLWSYQDRFYPGIYIDSLYVEGLKPAETLTALQTASSPLPLSEITLYSEEHTLASSAAELALHREHDQAVTQAFALGRSENWLTRLTTPFKLLLQPQRFTSQLAFDETAVKNFVAEFATLADEPGVEPSATLRVAGAPASLTINKGETGMIVNQPATVQTVLGSLHTQTASLSALLTTNTRALTEEELPAAQERAARLVNQKVTLKNAEGSIKLSDQDLVNLLAFPVGISETKLNALFEEWRQRLERAPQDAEFSYDPQTLVVTSFKPHKPGLTIDRVQTQQTLLELFEKIDREVSAAQAENKTHEPTTYEAELALEITQPEKTLAGTNQLGIEERIGFGESEYAHSIPSRIHNVAHAAKKINNFIIKPGEEFSFNRALGEVSRATGYQPAYVIKSGQTVLGDGGGVCQVSTTLFRSVLNAGLPVTKRKPHSYRVSYYELDTKPGIDATVYAGDVDLRFKNDTGHHVLIHANTDSEHLYMTVELYGTSDGRSTQIVDHKTWDYRSPPAAVYIPTDTLPSGRLKQIDWAASGIKASFKNIVKDKDGNLIREEEYYSNYVPWSAKYLRGI
ncbi:MAG TPA: VanW family protein [Vitreimonas sp.]|nr:VanW family protein [Vitreimonas sp.]